MTDDNAIEWLETLKRIYRAYPREVIEAWDIAIKALEEIQQYHSIGTDEECRRAVKRLIPEKTTVIFEKRKLIIGKCPNCNQRISGKYERKFCNKCGQAIDWSDHNG